MQRSQRLQVKSRINQHASLAVGNFTIHNVKVISKGSLKGHRGSLCTVCHLCVDYRKTNSEDLGPVYKEGGLP